MCLAGINNYNGLLKCLFSYIQCFKVFHCSMKVQLESGPAVRTGKVCD